MKVTRNIPQQLIVADTPWLIGIMLTVFILMFVGAGLALVISGEWLGLLFGAMGGGLGMTAFAIFVRRTMAILDRGTAKVTLRERSLFGFREEHHDLTKVRGAVVESSVNSNGQTTYRPTLVLRSGDSETRLPLIEVYSNGRGPDRVVTAINGWLGGDRLDSDPALAYPPPDLREQ